MYSRTIPSIVINPWQLLKVEVHPVDMAIGVVQSETLRIHKLAWHDAMALSPVQESALYRWRERRVATVEQIP